MKFGYGTGHTSLRFNGPTLRRPNEHALLGLPTTRHLGQPALFEHGPISGMERGAPALASRALSVLQGPYRG